MTPSSPVDSEIDVKKGALPILARAGRFLGGVLLLLGVALLAGGTALLYPYLRDDWALDQAVLAVALDWRDFGKEKAVDRLRLEFSERSIGHYVTESNCTFEADTEGRTVLCDWGVEVRLPGERRLPLRFHSRARITPEGDLR